MNWDYSTINHWWVAFGGDDRVWKITVNDCGVFTLSEGGKHYLTWDSLDDAKMVAVLHEMNLSSKEEQSIHA